IVSKLDRLTRSVGQLAQLLERSQREGWRLVALDLGIDTQSASGQLICHVMGAVAQWERRVISDRTREALRSLPRERRNGRPVYADETRARARDLRAEGHTLGQVAAVLTAEGVTPPRGGKALGPSTILRLLED